MAAIVLVPDQKHGGAGREFSGGHARLAVVLAVAVDEELESGTLVEAARVGHRVHEDVCVRPFYVFLQSCVAFLE